MARVGRHVSVLGLVVASSSPRRRLVVASVCLTLLSAAPAVAHDDVISSSPETGATVAAPPDVATVTFATDMHPGSALPFVTPPTGSRVLVLTNEVQVVGAVATVPVATVAPGAADGPWLIELRYVAADGHVGGYGIEFTVGEGDPTEAPVAARADQETSAGGVPWPVATMAALALALSAVLLVARARRR